MLLLHTLSRLTFTRQPWPPLLTGFLVHYAACEGYRPRLRHCVRCGRALSEEEKTWFDLREGGLCCARHRQEGMPAVTPEERAFLHHALETGSSSWVETKTLRAPLSLMEQYVGARLEKPLRVKAPA